MKKKCVSSVVLAAVLVLASLASFLFGETTLPEKKQTSIF